MNLFFRVLLAAAMLAIAPIAGAHDYTKGALTIDHPIVSPLNPPRTVTAGYFTIHNKGPRDRLVSASSPLAKAVEIHTHRKGPGGVMRMEMLKNGVVAPAKGKVAFAPGGLHLMIFGVTAAIKEGDAVPLTLVFEKAGTIDVVAIGEQPSQSGAGHQH